MHVYFFTENLIKGHLLALVFLALGFSLLVDNLALPDTVRIRISEAVSGSGSGSGNECGSMQVRIWFLYTADSSLFIPE